MKLNSYVDVINTLCISSEVYWKEMRKTWIMAESCSCFVPLIHQTQHGLILLCMSAFIHFHISSQPSQKEQKRLLKTMSSGDLGKFDSLRKSSSNSDGRSEIVSPSYFSDLRVIVFFSVQMNFLLFYRPAPVG